MNQAKQFAILLLVLTLASCNRETPSPSPQVTAIKNTPVSTGTTATLAPVLPIETKAPTLTLVPTATATDTLTPTPLPTPTVTPTLQPLPITRVISQCISMADSPAEGFLSDGMVLFYRQNLSDEPAINNLMKITADNLEPQELTGIPSSQTFWPEAVSPNHQWLFYRTYEDEKPVLLSTIQQPPQLVWLDGKYYGGWLDNENMIRFDGNLQVINPFTGESKELVLGIQDFYRDRWAQDQVPWNPLLDPTQTFVVYPKAGGTGGNARLAIRDLRSGEDVWIWDGYDIVYPPPAAWSPDGSKLVIASTKYSTPDRFELFIMDRELHAELWVDISGYIDGISSVPQWSPDGRYVFILGYASHGRLSSYEIGVLDTQTRQLTDYCDVMPDYYSTPWDARKNYEPFAVHWSPDGKQLALNVSADRNQTDVPHIINWVLDVEKHQAARLNLGSDHDIIMGWMVDPNAPTPTPTITPLPTSTPIPGTVNEVDGAALVRIPAGLFTMGANSGSTDFWGAEAPAHTITLGEFGIYQNEVTNAMYQACIAASDCPQPAKTASRTQPSYFGDAAFASYPVINVSYDAAAAYCQWAGGRLPTEAEWEKAARGDDGRLYPWGNDPLDATRTNSCDANCPADQANPDLNDGYADTAPVGSFPQGASPYGANDMAGNVLEWVADWFQTDYYATSPAENPSGPETGAKRVVRGGSWYNDASAMRPAARSSLNPADGYDTVGFRCVLP